MPKLATMLSKLVSFAADNPLLAGGAVVGAKAGGAMLGSVGSDLIGAMLSGGKRGGAAMAEAAGESGAWKRGGDVAGTAVAAKMIAAGTIAAAAIGLAHEQFKDLDKQTGGEASKTVDAAAAPLIGFDEKGSFSFDALGKDITEGFSDPMGFAKRKFKAAQRAEGKLRDFLKPVTSGGKEESSFVQGKLDSDARSRSNEKAQREAEAAIAADDALRKTAKSGDKSGESLDRVAAAAERTARALDSIGRGGSGGGGTNGLPPAPGNKSGSAPT
jgi:hypothetical protein